MKEFVEYLVKNLVDKPDDVHVTCHETNEELILEVKVCQNDIGKVVGRKGATIKALRTIAMMVCNRLGRRARLELIED